MASRADGHTDPRVLTDFVWAAVGGSVVLAAYASLLTLTMTLGGTLSGGAPMQAGVVAASPTYYASLAGMFMAGSVVILVVRSLTARKR